MAEAPVKPLSDCSHARPDPNGRIRHCECAIGEYFLPEVAVCLNCTKYDGDRPRLLAAYEAAQTERERERLRKAKQARVAPPPEVIAARAESCRSCEHLDRDRGGLRLVFGGYTINRAGCKKCGSCGNGVSLEFGQCPENRWVNLTAPKSVP